jgi:DNA polymerase III delta subunit
VATFSQWQRSGCPVRRITWVCGPEQVLSDDVAATVRAAFPSGDRAVYFAGFDVERDIWAACAVISPAGQERLVIVHDAGRLRRPHELVPLVKAGREAAGVYLLFSSAEDDFTRVSAPDGGMSLAPHLAAIRDSRNGQLIRCTLPKDDDLLDWAARQWPGLGRNAAHRLLARAGGDLAAVRDAGNKARASGLADEKYIDVLCEQRPGEEFAELLVAGDRKGALAAARDMPSAGSSGMGAVAGLLDYRLGVLYAIREGQRRGFEARDICGQLGVPRFLLARYRDIAGAYGPDRVRRCRELLAVADSAWRTGASMGVAEVLAANW